MNIERVKAVLTIVITAAVNIANIYGYAVDAEPVVTAVTTVLSAVSIAYAWWKNQNITDEAIAAQAVLDKLKAERKALSAGERK